jgi:phospholipase C
MHKHLTTGLMTGLMTMMCWSGKAIAQTTVGGTTTPIQHLVVIFDENISFDHYFGTYPRALNPEGEPPFTAAAATPNVNGLTPGLIAANQNPVPPFRLDRSQEVTCDNDNHYTDEQTAYHGGLIDKVAQTLSGTGTGCTPDLAMGYYDGNTITALWNYAQNFSMSDNFFATTFGTTVMGHLNLISGQTHQINTPSVTGKVVNGSVIANITAGYDDCGVAPVVQMSGRNVGDLLNAAGITWGWFYGDFTPVSTTGGTATCSSLYDSHYDPFQYYKSTANPHHLPPTSTAMIGQTDQANHQYALTDLWNAVAAGNLPAVTFVKASAVNTGHPATSTPLNEQSFLVQTINALMQTPQWNSMAILIAWDDSDGWYDHVMPPIVNPSNDPVNDTLAGTGQCGNSNMAFGAYQDRCGYGPRLPFLVISPYAKQNHVDHNVNDQTSILRFIEDNWGLPRIGDQSFDALAGSILTHFDFSAAHLQTVLLNPTSGAVTNPPAPATTPAPARGR